MPGYDFASLFGDEEEEENPLNRLTRSSFGIGTPMYKQLEGYDSNETPPIEENDPAVQHYMERSREPLPSQGMYQKFLESRPYEGDFKSNIWRKIGAALLGLGGQQTAARDLLHPGYRSAYQDWETQGRVLPSQARAADTGRTRELEAEKFNITGRARSKAFEETKRKNTASEAARSKKDEETRARQAITDKRAEDREERATRSESRLADSARRAEDNAKRAQDREDRAEREEGVRRDKERVGRLDKSYEERKKGFEGEEKDLQKQVEEAYMNTPENEDSYTVNKNTGKVVFSAEAQNAINTEISRLKKEREKKRPMKVEFDESNDVEMPKPLPPPPRRPEDKPWYDRWR